MMDDAPPDTFEEGGFFRRNFPTLTRILRCVFVLVCAVALLIVTAAVVFNFYGSARLRDARAHAAEAMAPLTHQGFRAKYPEVPAAENAALFYKAAFDVVRAGGHDEITDLYGAQERPAYPEDLPPPPSYLERLRAFLAEKRLVLEILREARRFEKADYGTNCDDPACTLEHLSRARECARLLAMAMYVAAADGRTEDGIGYARDCIALSRSLSREPLLIQALVAMATVSIACDTPLSAVLASGDAADEDLAALQEALLEYTRDFSIRAALEGELIRVNAIFEQIRAGHARTGNYTESPWYARSLPRWLTAGYLKADQANAIEVFLTVLREPGMDPAEVSARWDRRLETLEESPWLLSRRLMPALSRSVTRAEQTRARMQATALAVAALRFRNRTGRWPETPGEIAGLVDTVPQDPFTGGPFVFNVRDDGLLVYSVGENVFDDGGRPYLIPTPERERSQYDDVGFRIRLLNPESTGDAAE